MPGRQDTGYKLLFSHPEMVRDLLTGFVPGEWITEADFSTLERHNASFVSDSEKQRHDDMIWRVRIKDRWLWVYLLLEFQSRPDRWMAVRLLVYVGLLAQDLIRRKQLHDGRLPPILPLVLYNGEPRWRAPFDVRNCFVTPPLGLETFLPGLRYHLVDEARLKLHPAATVRNFAEILFKLERDPSPHDLRQLLLALSAVLQDDHSQSLRRAFNIVVKALLRQRVPAPNIGEVEQLNDILEAEHMLAKRGEGWFKDAERKGKAEGLAEGRQQLAATVQRLLTRRFGELPPAVRERLAQADFEQLEIWADRLLDAAALDEVFDGK